MRKVEGWITDEGVFFETLEQCVANEVVCTVVNEVNRWDDKAHVAKLIEAKYEIRRKDGA